MLLRALLRRAAGRDRKRRLLALAVLVGLVALGVEAQPAFVALDGDTWSLFRAGADGGEPVELRPDLSFDASAPAVSPDGKRIAFEVPGRGILVCPLAGEGRCETLRTEIGWPVRPTWNPATGELVFVRYVADAAGEDSDVLVASPDLTETRPLVSHTGNQDSPDVSPDGRFLVYDSAQTLGLQRRGVQVVRHLWIVDLESGAARPLVPGAGQDMHADVSPDGRWIAFASDRAAVGEGAGFDVWVVGVDGEGLRRLTDDAGSATWPAWSPDGTEILYSRSEDGVSELWKVSADGSGAAPWRPFGADSPSVADTPTQLRDPDWR